MHESTQAKILLEGKQPENVIADKAYDSNEIRAFIKKIGAEAVIPSNASRIKAIEHDRYIYRERCLVAGLFDEKDLTTKR